METEIGNEDEIKSFKVLIIEMKHRSAGMDSKLSELDNKMKALANTIADLDSISLLLNTLPQKTEQNLQAAVPAIAKAIERNLFSELGQKAHECYNVVSRAMSEADTLFKKDLKNKFQVIVLSVILSTCSAMAGCYYVMKQFPQRLFVETTGNVNANNSTISVIGKTPITAGKNNIINQYK